MAQLPRLRQGVPIGLTDDGKRIFPHPQFILFWQQFCDQLEAVPAIAAALEAQVQLAQDAADSAQASADAAQSAANDVSTATSLENSYITNFTPPLISADNLGNITIANHDRQYAGDPAPAPVAVTGATVPTAYVAGDIVRVYYDDPTRAGGAVTFLTTLDPTVAAQTGVRHSVGAVEIPAAGSQTGDPVRPPGYISLQ